MDSPAPLLQEMDSPAPPAAPGEQQNSSKENTREAPLIRNCKTTQNNDSGRDGSVWSTAG